jgi:S-DNA-T family DNA segregation ATPase FtsK/SpoIIIE
MANRLKSKKSQAPVSDKLKPEKESQVTVKQIVKDERTHKITGAVFLLMAVFLFIAFTSYLFTWKEDQDKVFQGASILLPSSHVKVTNLLGNLGALISHEFFYKGFGLASYLFCSIFFIVGVNLLFKRRVFSIPRNLRYVLTGLLFFSVAFAFITQGSGFPWGGAVGDMISEWLTRFLGWIGTAALLLVAGLAYFIWRFNPVFKVPTRPAKENAVAVPEPVAEVEEKPKKGKKGKKADEESKDGGKEGAKLFIDEEFSQGKGNVLKEESGVVALAPPPVKGEPEIEFTITEREPEEVEEDEEAVSPPWEDEGEDDLEEEPGEEPAPPTSWCRSICQIMSPRSICGTISIRRWICWRRMAARRSFRTRRSWRPTRTRSSIR